MHVRRRHSLLLVALLSGIVAPVAAKPSRTKVRKAATSSPKTVLGQRGAKLAYVTIPPAAWQPMMWGTQGGGGTAATVTFTHAVAPVSLPDGANIRELSCFGKFAAKDNAGEAIRLRRLPLDATNGGPILAKAVLGTSNGVQRADAKLEHSVNNFASAYQLEVTFNGKPQFRGCRIGYEL